MGPWLKVLCCCYFFFREGIKIKLLRSFTKYTYLFVEKNRTKKQRIEKIARPKSKGRINIRSYFMKSYHTHTQAVDSRSSHIFYSQLFYRLKDQNVKHLRECSFLSLLHLHPRHHRVHRSLVHHHRPVRPSEHKLHRAVAPPFAVAAPPRPPRPTNI